MRKLFVLFVAFAMLISFASCSEETVTTQAPTSEPTVVPTVVPTVEPTAQPTVITTVAPTAEPTETPTVVPTQAPTAEPTVAPTVVPTQAPTVVPTQVPTAQPTVAPTVVPTQAPTAVPTVVPTQAPTQQPTVVPTVAPTTVVQQKTTIDKLETVNFSVTATSRYIVKSNKVTAESNANYEAVMLEVNEGEKYVTTFSIQSSKSSGVLLADKDNKSTAVLFTGKNEYVEYNNVQITIPSGVKYMYINSRSPMTIKIQKLVKEEILASEVSSLPTSLNIGTVNCGAFEYVDGTTTTQTYQETWKALLRNSNYDLFMLEDCKDNFAEGILSNDVLNDGNFNNYYGGVSTDLRLRSKIQVESLTVIPLTYQIEGSSKVTARFTALRATFHIGTKHIAVYGLHLVAEGHINEEKQDDGTSLSQKLRQIQFQELINDTKSYDESILIGDFNAQISEEYDIFRNNGFSLANCGEFGQFATLRDIPADNIIISSGFKFDSMNVLSEYNLNTDHLGMLAQISLK